ncbi:kinesin-like protein KIF19 [Heterocephalus glaber]|uniref:Kinesin-like protein KIF19 n=1 Tax=Heterocephalus glaber TaxID=10181 RepID=A0AAX6RLU4_HETGA|nr:kinesin-like protein KIF19 [Heterocephalus glaber]
MTTRWRRRTYPILAGMGDSVGSDFTSSPDGSENLSEIPLAQKEVPLILDWHSCVLCRGKGDPDQVPPSEGFSWRLSQAQAIEGRHLLAPAIERSSLSLNSLSEADGARPPGPTLQHAARGDNLSSSTGEVPSWVIGYQADGPRPWLAGQKKTDKKREESLEEKTRKQRSLEVTGQGLSRPKTHIPRPHPRPQESTVGHKVPAYSHPAAGNQHPGTASLPLAPIRLPPSEGAGSGDALPLTVTSKPAGITRLPTRGPHQPHGPQDKDGLFRPN